MNCTRVEISDWVILYVQRWIGRECCWARTDSPASCCGFRNSLMDIIYFSRGFKRARGGRGAHVRSAWCKILFSIFKRVPHFVSQFFTWFSTDLIQMFHVPHFFHTLSQYFIFDISLKISFRNYLWLQKKHGNMEHFF